MIIETTHPIRFPIFQRWPLSCILRVKPTRAQHVYIEDHHPGTAEHVKLIEVESTTKYKAR